MQSVDFDQVDPAWMALYCITLAQATQLLPSELPAESAIDLHELALFGLEVRTTVASQHECITTLTFLESPARRLAAQTGHPSGAGFPFYDFLPLQRRHPPGCSALSDERLANGSSAQNPYAWERPLCHA